MKVKSSYELKHKQTLDIVRLQIHYAQTYSPSHSHSICLSPSLFLSLFGTRRYECETMPENSKKKEKNFLVVVLVGDLEMRSIERQRNKKCIEVSMLK